MFTICNILVFYLMYLLRVASFLCYLSCWFSLDLVGAVLGPKLIVFYWRIFMGILYCLFIFYTCVIKAYWVSQFMNSSLSVVNMFEDLYSKRHFGDTFYSMSREFVVDWSRLFFNGIMFSCDHNHFLYWCFKVIFNGMVVFYLTFSSILSDYCYPF